MEILEGDFTQKEYNELRAELMNLEMKVQLGEDSKVNKDRIAAIKKEIKEKLGE